MTQTLIDGVALGWNPTKTARAMADGLTGGLQRALVISRTEQMRVYREAQVQQYKSSGLVTYYKRMSAHDGRVCAACLALDGTRLEVGETIGDHPNGRCCVVPVVDGEDEPTWTAGEDWFKEQDEGMQREILGPGRFELWREGKLEFGKLAVHTHDPVWGAGVRMATMKELEKGSNVIYQSKILNFNNNKIDDLGKTIDLRDYYPDGTPGKDDLSGRDIVINSKAKQHIINSHEDQVDWTGNNQDIIQKAIKEPSIISNKPIKNKGKWSVTQIVEIDHDLYDIFVIGIRHTKTKNEVITMFLADKRFIYVNDKLKKRWKYIKK